MMYNTGLNTMGMGEVRPPKKVALTSTQQNDDRFRGSGDIFPHVGEAPSTMWCQEWKDKREECLLLQALNKNKIYDISEERPLLVFSEELMANESDYQAIYGKRVAMSPDIDPYFN